MANPTPRDVSAKTAPAKPEPLAVDKRGYQPSTPVTASPPPRPTPPAPTTTTTTTPAPVKAPAKAPEPPKAVARYRVLKAITLEDGRTVMPGETFEIPASWPARRHHQLVDQKFLRPMNDAARDDAKAATAEE